MNDEDIRLFLSRIEDMLRDPTCEVEHSTTVIKRPNFETGYMDFEPGDGKTLVIKVRGGSRGMVDEDPDTGTARLIQSLRPPIRGGKA